MGGLSRARSLPLPLSLTHTQFKPFPLLFFFCASSSLQQSLRLPFADEPTPGKTKESLAGGIPQQPRPLERSGGGLEAAECGQKTRVQPWGESFGKLLFSLVGHQRVYEAPPFHYFQAPRVQSDGSFFLYIFS